MPSGFNASTILGFAANSGAAWGDPFQDNIAVTLPPNQHTKLVPCWENGSTTPMVKSITNLVAGANGVFPPTIGGNAAFLSASQHKTATTTTNISESVLTQLPELATGNHYQFSYYVRNYYLNEFSGASQYRQNENPLITIKLLDKIGASVQDVPTYNVTYPNDLQPGVGMTIDQRLIIGNNSNKEWTHYVVCFDIPLSFHNIPNHNPSNDYLLIAADIPSNWINIPLTNLSGSFYIADLELIESLDPTPICFTQPLPTIGSVCNLFGSTFNWTGPNNFSATTQTITPTIAGSYTVNETLINPTIQIGACNLNKNFVVNASPILPTDADTWVVCSGTTITLGTPQNTNPNYSYNWSIPALGVAYFTPTIAITPSITPAQLMIYLTITDNITGCTNSRVYTVRVNPTPNPFIQGPNVICGVGTTPPIGGPSITLNSSITSSNYTYSWAVVTNPVPLMPPIPLPNATNWITGAQYNASTLTTHKGGGFYLKITDNTTGCSAMSPVFPVIEGNIPVVTLSEPFYNLCSANILPAPNNPYFSNWAYTTATVAPYTYSWTSTIAGSFNPTNSTTTPALSNYVDFVPTPGPFSSFNYSVTVTDALGCIGTATCVVTVNPSPTISVVPPTICYGSSTTLTAIGGTTGGTYIWSFNPNGVPALQSSSSNTFNTGVLNTTTTYYVKYIDFNGCDATTSAIVTVRPKINLSFTANPSVLCSNASSTLVGVNVTGGTPPYNSPIWSPGITNINNTATYFSGTLSLINGNSVFFQINDSKQCGASGTFTLNYGNAPIINMPSDVIYCTNTTGKNVTASFTGTAPFSNIIWTSSPIIAPFTYINTASNSTISAAPTSLTSYTLHVTDANGCTSTKQLNIQPHTASFTLNTSSSLYCDFNPVTISASSTSDVGGINPSTPNTFNWTPAGITTSMYQNSVNVQPSALTTYSITMTDKYGCVATQSTIVDNNCCTGVGITLPTLISSFIASNPSNMLTNGAYSFLGGSVPHKVIMGGNYYVPANQTLIVDDNIEFFMCNIFMGTNSKIVVNDPKFLYLTNNTNIKSCQNMWNGIYMTTSNISNPMIVNLYMDNSSLKDAIDGVVSNAGSVFYINNSTFDRNLTSLNVNSFQYLPHAGIIKNSTITCSVPFLRFPYNNTPSKIGIAIKDVKNITISNNSISKCKDYGIRVFGGLTNGRFNQNSAQISYNFISNCNTAIYFRGSSGYVHHNNIAAAFNPNGSLSNWSGNNGVSVDFLQSFMKMDIIENTFNSLNTGILTRLNFGKINITNNTINSIINKGSVNVQSTNFKLTCGIANDEFSNQVKISATDNHIYNCNIGFYLRNLRATYVNKKNPTYQHEYYNNDVHLNINGINTSNWNTPADNIGFYMENCFGNMIQCNQIDCNMNNGNEQFQTDYGIYLTTNTSTNFIDGNHIQGISNGIQAEGSNPSNFLIANYFDNNANGIVIHNQFGEIGKQGLTTPPIPNLYYNKTHWGNSWDNMYPSARTTYSYGGTNANPANRKNQKIYVRANESTPYYYSATNVPSNGIGNIVFGFDNTTLLPAKFYYEATYPSMAGCETGSAINNSGAKTSIVGDEMLRTAQDTSYTTPEEGMNDFFERMALYNTLKQIDSLKNEDSILVHFENREDYENLGKLYNANTEIALAYDSSYYVFDSLNIEYTDSINNAYRISHLYNALNYINDINTPLQAIQYYQSINQQYLYYLINDSLDAGQLQTVKDIAALCIYTYGPAVSQARSLAAFIDSTAAWDDNYTCYGNMRQINNNDNDDYLANLAAINAERNSKKDATSTMINNFELYPNPASTEVTIRYKNIPLNCKIIIYNTIGIKVIEQATINENGSTTINVAKLINGLYLYKIVDSNNRCIAKNKFTITK